MNTSVPGARYLNPDDLSPPNGYSHVVDVVASRVVYISGQVPLDAAGELVGKGDFEAQARQCSINVTSAEHLQPPGSVADISSSWVSLSLT